MKSGLTPILLISWIITAPLALAEEKAATANVTTTPLQQLQFHPEYSAPATTVSLNNSRIGAETSGRIEQIPVKVGEQVEKGALLIALDCRDNRIRHRQAKSLLQAAEARLILARRQIDRTQSLRKDRNVSEELLNQREADVETAKAERLNQMAALERAQLDEERCQITAPFAGIVMERLANEGEWINASQPLIRLLDNQRLEVSAQVPVDSIGSLSDTSELTFKANGSYPLVLGRILAAVDTRGRHREVRLAFKDTKALPGSAGRLIWRATAPYLPADLLLRRGDSLGVFLYRDGKAQFHPLPGALEGHPARIDLPADSLLIIEGRRGLSDGDEVEARD